VLLFGELRLKPILSVSAAFQLTPLTAFSAIYRSCR
jgi:hypothetical protein